METEEYLNALNDQSGSLVADIKRILFGAACQAAYDGIKAKGFKYFLIDQNKKTGSSLTDNLKPEEKVKVCKKIQEVINKVYEDSRNRRGWFFGKNAQNLARTAYFSADTKCNELIQYSNVAEKTELIKYFHSDKILKEQCPNFSTENCENYRNESTVSKVVKFFENFTDFLINIKNFLDCLTSVTVGKTLLTTLISFGGKAIVNLLTGNLFGIIGAVIDFISLVKNLRGILSNMKNDYRAWGFITGKILQIFKKAVLGRRRRKMKKF
jgi:hypothetical protein